MVILHHSHQIGTFGAYRNVFGIRCQAVHRFLKVVDLDDPHVVQIRF